MLMDAQNQETESYLTFKLGEEEFGVHVSQVLNILEMTRITDVPKTPDYMKGVINLRGMVLPVIDTRVKFGMPEAEYTHNTCIVVMDIDMDEDTIHVGAIVDEVLSVVEIEKSQIEPPPSLGNQYKSDFISGMAKLEEQFVMLLDMKKVFSEDEIAGLAETTKQEPAEG
jgi:purine-binding chemotaxis protein CheW